MRILAHILLLLALPSIATTVGLAADDDQEQLEYLGLAGQALTSLSVYSGIVAAGSEGNGVFWQVEDLLPGAGWEKAGLEGHDVRSVYPHKSGPIGWAIGAGVRPSEDSAEFVFCSFMGQGFEPLSGGIDPELTWEVSDLDGFPDPSICGETYAAGGRALYRRLFGSPQWDPVYTTTVEGNVYTVVAHEYAPGVVIAGGGEGFAGMFFLIRSGDFGDTWEELYPPGFVLDVDFAGETADLIFAAVGTAVLRSVDGGTNWEPVFTSDLPNGDHISEVVIAPAHERVYIGGASWWSEAPLFTSDDWGESWERIPTGLPGEISALHLASDESLLIAHHDEGVFRLDAEDVGSGEIPGPSVILYPNHPNPFNPYTTVSFALNRSGYIELGVYATTGRRVTMLAKGEFAVGFHELTWNGRDFRGRAMPSGAYIVRLETESGVEAQKVMLIR